MNKTTKKLLNGEYFSKLIMNTVDVGNTYFEVETTPKGKELVASRIEMDYLNSLTNKAEVVTQLEKMTEEETIDFSYFQFLSLETALAKTITGNNIEIEKYRSYLDSIGKTEQEVTLEMYKDRLLLRKLLGGT